MASPINITIYKTENIFNGKEETAFLIETKHGRESFQYITDTVVNALTPLTVIVEEVIADMYQSCDHEMIYDLHELCNNTMNLEDSDMGCITVVGLGTLSDDEVCDILEKAKVKYF